MINMKLGLILFFISFFSLGADITKDDVYAAMIRAYLMQDNEAEAIRVVPYLKNVNYEHKPDMTLFRIAVNLQANKLVGVLLEKGIELEKVGNRAAINAACIHSNLSVIQSVFEYGFVADYLMENVGEIPSCVDYSLMSGNDKLFELIIVYGVSKNRDKFCNENLLAKLHELQEFKARYNKICWNSTKTPE